MQPTATRLSTLRGLGAAGQAIAAAETATEQKTLLGLADAPNFGSPSPREYTDRAGFVWYSGPHAIRDGDWTILGIKGVSNYPEVYAYNHVTGQEITHIFGDQTPQYDDHENGVTVKAADGHYVHAYSLHTSTPGVEDKLFVSRSTNPNDPTSWEAAVPHDANGGGASYSQMYVLPNGDIIDFLRRQVGGDREWLMMKSVDNGVTWTREHVVYQPDPLAGGNNAAYFVSEQSHVNPNRIDFLGNPSPPGYGPQYLHHWYYLADVKKWYASDGTEIADDNIAPVIEHADATTIYNAGTSSTVIDGGGVYTITGNVITVLDVAHDAAGNPWVMWTEKPADTDLVNRLYVSVYDPVSNVWSSTLVVEQGTYYAEGSQNYVAIPAFRYKDPQTIITPVQVNGVYEIHQFRGSQGGRRWVKVAELTKNSTKNNIRVCNVHNSIPDEGYDVFWLGGGDYPTFQSWTVKLRARDYSNTDYLAGLVDSNPDPVAINVTGGNGISVEPTGVDTYEVSSKVRPDAFGGTHFYLPGGSSPVSEISGDESKVLVTPTIPGVFSATHLQIQGGGQNGYVTDIEDAAFQTCAAVIKVDDVNIRTIFGTMTSGGTENGFEVRVGSSGTVKFHLRANGATGVVSNIAADPNIVGKWVFVCWAIGDTNQTLAISQGDAPLLVEDVTGASPALSGRNISFGTHHVDTATWANGMSWLEGHVIDRKLNAYEVEELYNDCKARAAYVGIRI